MEEKKLDEILDWQTQLTMRQMFIGENNITKELIDRARADAKQQLLALIKEARIDEIQNFLDFYKPGWSKDIDDVIQDLKDRLKQLKEQSDE